MAESKQCRKKEVKNWSSCLWGDVGVTEELLGWGGVGWDAAGKLVRRFVVDPTITGQGMGHNFLRCKWAD